MPPTTKKAGVLSNADTAVMMTQQHPLQAVVLADSFTRTFRPMSLERPKVLLPVANSPMIEYTLEMLACAKVNEIIVVCCWHASQVAEYVRQSRWGTSKNPVVKVVSYPKADSAGTALRELASTQTVQSDPFILVSGDVVSNVHLGPILKAHKARQDSNKIMTMIFRKTNPGNPLRNLDDDLVLAIDAETKQLLLYEVKEGEPDEDNEAEISLKLGKDKFFDKHPKVEIRHDLLDCHIDICSPQVLEKLQDEFYEDLRLDMVHKEVSNLEMGHHFYVHELTMPHDYAARVHCVRSYDQVSRDVIGRWLYPLTPDNNWACSDSTCWFTRGFTYRETGVQLDRTAMIGRSTMLGADSTIAEGVVIENSVLGRRVSISAKAKIEGSYIWDGAIIGAGAHLDRALICNDVVIGAGAKIMRGAIISFGVTVEPNQVILPFARLTKADPYVDDRGSWDDGSEDDNDQPQQCKDLVSSPSASTARHAKLTIRTATEDVFDDEVEGTVESRKYRMSEEGFDAPSLPAWAEKALDDAEGIGKVDKFLVMGSMGCDELERAKPARSWFASSHTGGEQSGSMPEEEDDIGTELANLLSDFLSKGTQQRTHSYYDNLSMELKGLRASRSLCSFEEIVGVSFAILLQSTLIDLKSLSAAQVKGRLTSLVDVSAPLLKNFTMKILGKETDLQVALIQASELCCLFGPARALEVLIRLPTVDNSLENALDLDDTPSVLKESEVLRSRFIDLLSSYIRHGIIDLPALQGWKDERVSQKSTILDSTPFLDVFKASEAKVDQLISALVQEEEE